MTEAGNPSRYKNLIKLKYLYRLQIFRIFRPAPGNKSVKNKYSSFAPLNKGKDSLKYFSKYFFLVEKDSYL
jgi:hypothetical protein